jgi:hypothetical protein
MSAVGSGSEAERLRQLLFSAEESERVGDVCKAQVGHVRLLHCRPHAFAFSYASLPDAEHVLQSGPVSGS